MAEAEKSNQYETTTEEFDAIITGADAPYEETGEKSAGGDDTDIKESTETPVEDEVQNVEKPLEESEQTPPDEQTYDERDLRIAQLEREAQQYKANSEAWQSSHDRLLEQYGVQPQNLNKTTVPVEDTVPQDYMPEGMAYEPDDVARPGTASYEAWQKCNDAKTKARFEQWREEDRIRQQQETVNQQWASLQAEKSVKEPERWKRFQQIMTMKGESGEHLDLFKVYQMLDMDAKTQQEANQRVLRHRQKVAESVASPVTGASTDVDMSDKTQEEQEDDQFLEECYLTPPE